VDGRRRLLTALNHVHRRRQVLLTHTPTTVGCLYIGSDSTCSIFVDLPKCCEILWIVVKQVVQQIHNKSNQWSLSHTCTASVSHRQSSTIASAVNKAPSSTALSTALNDGRPYRVLLTDSAGNFHPETACVHSLGIPRYATVEQTTSVNAVNISRQRLCAVIRAQFIWLHGRRISIYQSYTTLTRPLTAMHRHALPTFSHSATSERAARQKTRPVL